MVERLNKGASLVFSSNTENPRVKEPVRHSEPDSGLLVYILTLIVRGEATVCKCVEKD